MELIEPRVRPRTPTSAVNRPQCGGVKQGPSGFVAEPNTHGFVKWHTKHPDKEGMCQLRISEGFFNEEDSYTVLKPVSGTVDEDGWFKCGRRANSFEQRRILFPDVICDMCTLQLKFQTKDGIIYQCSDITLTVGENISCEGMCKNGGSCYNGKCLCRSGYGGKYCDGKGEMGSTNPSLWFILFIILLIIAFMVVFALCVVRFINKKEKRYYKESPDNTMGADVYDSSVIGATTYDQDIGKLFT